VLAFITDPPVIGRILEHLRLPSGAPAVAPGPARTGAGGLAEDLPVADSCGPATVVAV